MRHAEVRGALRDFEQFESRHGVAGDAFCCTILQGNSVVSDAPRHTALRRAMEPPLQRQALHEVQERFEAAADTLGANITDGDSFDAIGDIAQSLPLTVLRDMVSLPLSEQYKILAWTSAAPYIQSRCRQRCPGC